MFTLGFNLRKGFSVGQCISRSFSHLFYFFSPFSSFDPDVSWLYIVSQNASWLYIWRVRITLPWYLSHEGLISRFYTEIFSCVGTVHGHFPINVARQVVVMHLLWMGWLLCPSFFLSLWFSAKLHYSLFRLHYAPFTMGPCPFEVRWESSKSLLNAIS